MVYQSECETVKNGVWYEPRLVLFPSHNLSEGVFLHPRLLRIQLEKMILAKRCQNLNTGPLSYGARFIFFQQRVEALGIVPIVPKIENPKH